METEIVPEEFEAETLPHINDLYRTAVRLTRSRTDAEDLVQETYLQAWKSFQQYEPGTNCRAWLFKILLNKFEHFRRRQYTRQKYIQEPADDFVFQTAVYEDPVPEQLTDDRIIRALNRLPEHYRSVVLLADVNDFSYREIAAILEIPTGTVMSRLNRARFLLRKSLAETAVEYGIRISPDRKNRSVAEKRITAASPAPVFSM